MTNPTQTESAVSRLLQAENKRLVTFQRKTMHLTEQNISGLCNCRPPSLRRNKRRLRLLVVGCWLLVVVVFVVCWCLLVFVGVCWCCWCLLVFVGVVGVGW